MIAFFARHPTAANLLMGIFVLLGVLTLPTLQRETYPVFEPRAIDISVVYPGADAEIVDETVVERIEQVVLGLEGIAEVTSVAREGSAWMRVEVEDGASLDRLLSDVQSAVDGLRDMPEDTDPPVIRAAVWRPSVASVAVSGAMSSQDLQRYCELLRRDLLHQPEVSLVTVAGFSAHQLQVRLRPAALAQQGMSLADVAAAISAHHVDVPVGSIERAGGDILVRYSDRRLTADALANVVVKAGANGGEVPLSEIAELRDAFAVEEEQLHFNGERACVLTVTKTASQDSLDVLAGVERFLEEQEAKKPEGVTLAITQNSASTVEKQIRLLVTNAVQGLALVFLTLWLFFHVRLAFWVALGLPVSVLGALWVMELLDQTLNMMTMMGMLIAVGLVMDDAIVLAENVAAHLERGKSALRAAIDGVKEVAGGVVSSFATTLCVFVPLASIDGRIGRVLQVIPAVLVSVLAVSLVEAFFVLPSHLAHALEHVDLRAPSRARAWFNRSFDRVRERVLGRSVDFAVRHRWAVVGLVIAAFLASAAMVTSGRLRYVAFPSAEGNIAEFRLALPPGAALEQTKDEVQRVVQAAWRVSEALTPEQPEGKTLVRNVSARFNYNPDVEETGPHLATVSVDLLPVEERATTLDAFSRAWRQEVGPLAQSATARFTQAAGRGPAGNPIEVMIESSDIASAEAVSEKIQAWFRGFAGVFDVTDDLDPGSEQVRVRLREGTASTQLTGSTVASQIRAALAGVSVATFRRDGIEYEIFVELQRHGRDTLADLESLPIYVAPGVTAPLSAVATIERVRSYARVHRRGGMRTVTVTGDVDPEIANAATLMRQFEREALPAFEQEFPAVRLRIGGAALESEAALGSMSRRFVLGIFGIFVLLSLQFRSYAAPLLVMLAIPFAFIGVVWGHLALGMPLSSQSIFGFIAISGIVVNDSILLMVFLQTALAKKGSLEVAARQAGRDRFRAVLLTSATTIAGLFPLLFETSRHAQSLIPVAASIVFGLMASTVLVLVVLPASTMLLADLGVTPRPREDPVG